MDVSSCKNLIRQNIPPILQDTHQKKYSRQGSLSDMSLNNSSHILGLNGLKHSVIHLDMTILIYLKK